MLLPNPTWPTPIEVEATHYQTPVTADTIGSMVDAAVHLAAVKFRPSAHNLVTYDTSSAFAGAVAPAIEQLDPDYVNSEVHTPLLLSPFATAVAVAISYQARPVATHEPVISARLELKGGAVLDAGVEWSETGGTLPLAESHEELGPVVIGVYPIQVVTTGVERSLGGDPRALEVGAGAGQWVDVVVTSEHARVTGVSVIEIPDES